MPGRSWPAQRELLRATAAGQRRESLLYLLIAVVAAGILSASVLAWTASANSYRAELAAVGAPALLFTVPAADAGTFAGSLRGSAGLTSVGSPSVRSQWSAAAGSRSLTADLTVNADSGVPRWLHVEQGPARDSAPAAWIERGAAATLHVSPGSSLQIAGPAGTRTVPVAGLVGDLSQDAYPLTTPAAVYLSPAAGTELGLTASVSGAQALIPVWEAPSATDAQISAAAATASKAAHAGTYSYSSLGDLPSSVAPLTSFTIGGAAVFGVVALVCLLVALASSVALEVRRQERWLGQLRAVGWSVRQLRTLLLWQRLPALVSGAVAGSVAGAFLGRVLAGQVTELYGSDPHTASPWLVGAVISAAVAGAGTAVVYRAGRRLKAGRVASQLRGRGLDASASVGLSRWWGRTAARQLAAAAVAGRRLRTISFASLIGLAVAAVVFGVVLGATLVHATEDPAAWGINYTWAVDLPSGTPAQTAATQLSSASGVASADPMYSGTAQLGQDGPSVAFDLLPAGQSADKPPVVTGRLPQSAAGISVSSGLAASDGLTVGSRVQLIVTTTKSVTVTVTGVTREIGESGNLIRGTTALESSLSSVVSQESVLVTCSGTCPALPSVQAHSGWHFNSAEAEIALPFGATISVVLAVLVLSLVLLAGTIAGYGGLAVAQQLLPAYGLARAVGAQRSQLARAVGFYCLLVAVPALVGGLAVGLAAASGGVSAVTSSVGGMSVSAPKALIGAAALGACALACLSVAGPLLRSASRVPVKALGG